MAQKRSHDQSTSPTGHPSSRHNGQGSVKISRKIRACKECQGRKIRCDMGPGEHTCSRCQRLGLECVVNKSLQTLLEDENEWKVTIEGQMAQMHSAIVELLKVTNLPAIAAFDGRPLSAVSSHSAGNQITPSLNAELRADLQAHISPQSEKISPGQQTVLPGMAMTRENSQEPQIPEGEAVVEAPMASLFEVTKLRNLRSNLDGRKANISPMEGDFISQGKISEEEAETLFSHFKSSLNNYLWGGIALVHDSLKSVRNSSSQLSAAILAVTALHVPNAEDVFDKCYDEFLNLVSASMFDRYHTLDDVRGLCIGAFWLSDVSWKLSGHAVRIGTELNLHHSFARAMRGSEREVERARLWYLLYVCDHHFSIAYGRPPVTHENEAITHHESFLRLPGITQADYRLQSQVGVFLILSRIFHTFGTDSARTLTDGDFNSVEKYNNDLDLWAEHWEPLLAPNQYVNSYPAKGVTLHCRFAKVQLNALVLRGVSSSDSGLSAKRYYYANLAISNAISTLEVVLGVPDVTRSVVGVPLYLTTLISYCTMFLLKVQLTWKNLRLEIDTLKVMDLLERVVALLNNAEASGRHLALHLAVGLGNMLAKFKKVAPQSVKEQDPMMPMSVSSIPLPDMGNWGTLPIGDAIYGDVMNFIGMDEQYFPLGIFDALPAQVPQ